MDPTKKSSHIEDNGSEGTVRWRLQRSACRIQVSVSAVRRVRPPIKEE